MQNEANQREGMFSRLLPSLQDDQIIKANYFKQNQQLFVYVCVCINIEDGGNIKYSNNLIRNWTQIEA